MTPLPQDTAVCERSETPNLLHTLFALLCLINEHTILEEQAELFIGEPSSPGGMVERKTNA